MQSSLLMARGDRQGRENSDTWDMIIKISTKGHYYIKISTVKTRRDHTNIHCYIEMIATLISH